MTEPASPKNAAPEKPDLAAQTELLRNEVAKLNEHRFVQLHNSVPKLLGLQFARGLAFGLGTVVGASVLVSVLVYTLSFIDFLPIIGDWASELARQIQSEVGANPESTAAPTGE